MLMDKQLAELHKVIEVKCSQSHYIKRNVHMLSNSEDLQLYLQLAFDHFSQNLDDPFNFVEVALKINPIPSDFSGNILKLAVAIKANHPLWTLVKIFKHLSLMVASCIMLDIGRHRRLGKQQSHFTVINLLDGIIYYCYADDYGSRNAQRVA